MARQLEGREATVHLGLAGLFLAVAVPLAMLAPSDRAFAPEVVAALTLAYAVASLVEFEVGAGYTVPTQLVLVPMLLVLPTPVVPLLVAAGFLIGGLPSYLTGRANPGRAVISVWDAWHAVGPAAVLIVADAQTPGWHHWPIYVGALAAQILFDYVGGAVRDLLALGIRPSRQASAMAWVYVVDVLLSPLGLLAAFAATTGAYAPVLVLPVVGLFAVFARERRRGIEAALELSRAYRGTALLLGDVVEADDAYTGEHSRDVVELSVQVASEMGLDDDVRRRVEFAALLHDVGKISIPKSIINKPGPLTSEERDVIETHTIEGQRLLEKVGGALGEVGAIVRASHEHYDGSGYPDGLAGRAIPVEARIVACCDAFSAITTDRPYRAARPLDDAVGELVRHAGTQFDPAVVEILVALIDPRGECRHGAAVIAPPSFAAH